MPGSDQSCCRSTLEAPPSSLTSPIIAGRSLARDFLPTDVRKVRTRAFSRSRSLLCKSAPRDHWCGVGPPLPPFRALTSHLELLHFGRRLISIVSTFDLSIPSIDSPLDQTKELPEWAMSASARENRDLHSHRLHAPVSRELRPSLLNVLLKQRALLHPVFAVTSLGYHFVRPRIHGRSPLCRSAPEEVLCQILGLLTASLLAKWPNQPTLA
jgi:hypothetical protein